MRKYATIAAITAMLCGCSWFGGGDDSTTTAVAENEAQAAPVAQAQTAEPATATAQGEPGAAAKSAAKATAKKAVKGAKTEAQIKAELDQMGKKLAAQSGRTVMPNKSRPDYRQAGDQWVASFIEVNPNEVTTEMRPGSNGTYVGVIRYSEHFMECQGATKQAALSGSCTQVKSRNLSELIRYDGKAWQD